ncbi:MAG: beta-ketoacyl synthase chain length factor [Dokdonella sp.]|uniref:beta-ketoacyl synthase chain length factor n=1 Tax=Dokdonella sp. TaxID=2291710 RepID=UPI003F80E396
MNGVLTVHVEGIGWRSPGLADWRAACALLHDGGSPALLGASGASPAVLPPTERRRAPETVLLACDVAGQACAMAAREPAQLPCVFASMHGDLAITEHMCMTLAANPLELSPTKFHNSVLNAATGYWTVATRCHAPSTALSASGATFAVALLEAAAQAHADGTPVLFAAYDAGARGALAEAMRAEASVGVAFVLSPERGAHTVAALRLRHDGSADADDVPAQRGGWLDAALLPLLGALAHGHSARLRLPAGRGTALAIEVLA